MIIVFASWNPKKCEELQRMAPEGIDILCLKDFPKAKGKSQANENGDTFLDNAIIKAKYWAEILGFPVLAEDSGLEIEALDGYPGVRTKRCLEDLCPGADINVDNPAELYPVLLKLIEESGNSSKEARWVSAMAFVNGEKIYTAESSLIGEMCYCRGIKEFGFDQYFKPHDFDITLSEMTPEQKDNIGPRFKAFIRILDQL